MSDIRIDRYVRVGDTLPISPKIGQIFFLVSSGSNNGMYACEETGIWNKVNTSYVAGQ